MFCVITTDCPPPVWLLAFCLLSSCPEQAPELCLTAHGTSLKGRFAVLKYSTSFQAASKCSQSCLTVQWQEMVHRVSEHHKRTSCLSCQTGGFSRFGGLGNKRVNKSGVNFILVNIVTLENSLSVAHGTEMMEKHVLLGIDCPLGNLPSRPPGVVQLPVHVLISTLPSLDVLKTPCRIRELLITNVEVWCVLDKTHRLVAFTLRFCILCGSCVPSLELLLLQALLGVTA